MSGKSTASRGKFLTIVSKEVDSRHSILNKADGLGRVFSKAPWKHRENGHVLRMNTEISQACARQGWEIGREFDFSSFLPCSRTNECSAVPRIDSCTVDEGRFHSVRYI